MVPDAIKKLGGGSRENRSVSSPLLGSALVPSLTSLYDETNPLLPEWLLLMVFIISVESKLGWGRGAVSSG